MLGAPCYAMGMKPTIFVTVGLPASGKTYFTEKLAKDLDIFFLNCDALRMAMYETPTFNAKEHAVVYGAANFITMQHALQKKSMICNANFNFRRSRDAIHQATKQGGVEFKIIWMQAPLELVTERMQTRDHVIPKEKAVDPPLQILAKQRRNLQPPDPATEPVIIIDGTISYEQQLAQFRQQAGDLFA